MFIVLKPQTKKGIPSVTEQIIFGVIKDASCVVRYNI